MDTIGLKIDTFRIVIVKININPPNINGFTSR